MRKLGKSQIRFEKYVKEFYLENDLAYISCNVKGYDDIIDDFSVEGYEWISEPFARFIEENANYIPTEYPIVLEICGGKFSKKEKACIEETVADYYALQMGDIQLALEKNTQKSMFLAGMFLIFLIICYFVMSGLNSIFSEVLVIFVWVALWDLIENAVFDRRDLIEQKTEAAQMASIKVTFRKEFEDAPVNPEEEKSIIREVFEDEVIVPSTEWE